jgi:hypothetical protein
MQLNDGRFACGLNFGNAAFDGSNRWIQVEFRNPAGSGQYQALSPRDKITATPYALYALNGANGVWVYDTNQQSVSVTGKKVGIGTSNPTAALEVVSATGGDDSVKLPAGSIGLDELAPAAKASAFEFEAPMVGPPTNRSFSVASPCVAVLLISGVAGYGASGTVSLDGVDLQPFREGPSCCGGNDQTKLYGGTKVVPLAAGQHQLTISGGSTFYDGRIRVAVVLVGSGVD